MSSRLLGSFLAVALVAGSATFAADTPSAPAAAGSDPVVARVNGKELHRSDVAAYQHILPPQFQRMPLEQIYPMLIEQMVSTILVTEAARKEHLADDPDVKRRLAQDEGRIMGQTYMERLVTQAATDSALHAQFDKYLKEHPPQEEVSARHILVGNEDEAKAVIAELGKGADFAALAKQHSTDPSKDNGGDLGWFSRDQMVPEFSDAVFKLNKGDYTKEPVKTQFGYHVIKLEDRREGKPATFDEVKDELKNEIARDVVEKKLKELRANGKVETFALDGSAMPVKPVKNEK
jgi:peptidyl-prolyl cis-trans isomerase C